jgi:hypothetical protein
MAKKSAGDERLRRIGRSAYHEALIPPKRGPRPKQTERIPDMKTYAGVEFAREPLSSREIGASISARSRVLALQHIVQTRSDESGAVRPPWNQFVVARCRAKLRRAAVKRERKFLDLALCPTCAVTLLP